MILLKSDEIKEAALKYFTIHGYEGASLSQIADEVGMKKQSIYAHFKGKDDLFLQVLRDVKESEWSAIVAYFNKKDSQQPEKDLYGFLLFIIDLFQKDEQMKFWLRMTFFPPAHLAEQIEYDVIDIESKVQAILKSKFQEWIDADTILKDEAMTPTYAFLGIMDSIMMELVYGNDEQRLRTKLESSWRVFWRGITHR
ncbi:TetR/AcrR family transcriptional regulator [Paenibacillus sp. GXUN7292]|uniref:TetR/AcrR family transcriptional regulator n=1 Tax=Paenibacillus sp. GXUN7292 TaxID=3422499 RepID=UPI003D7D6C5D